MSWFKRAEPTPEIPDDLSAEMQRSEAMFADSGLVAPRVLMHGPKGGLLAFVVMPDDPQAITRAFEVLTHLLAHWHAQSFTLSFHVGTPEALASFTVTHGHAVGLMRMVEQGALAPPEWLDAEQIDPNVRAMLPAPGQSVPSDLAQKFESYIAGFDQPGEMPVLSFSLNKGGEFSAEMVSVEALKRKT